MLCWTYRDALFTMCDFSIFPQNLSERLRQRHKARIASSLSVFTSVLNNRGALFLSPHGFVSSDGHMAAFKSGLFQILNGSNGEV